MVHCQDCQATLDSGADITFREVDSAVGFVRASKRFYVVECGHCGATIGSGVAGAKANSGGAAT